jgi:hypothetical protein
MFFIKIFSLDKFVENMDGGQVQDLYRRIHLKISKGGMGITPSAAISGAAYVGSMALSLGWIAKLIPDLLNSLKVDGAYIPSIASLITHLEIAKQLCPKDLEATTLESMILKQTPQIQKIISTAINQSIAEELDRNLNQIVAGGGELTYTSLSLTEQERSIQHKINKNPINHGFLTANPCAPLCGMSNDAFSIAVQHRLLMPIGESRQYCLCGDKVGSFLSHVARCPTMRIRNQVRNTMHKELKWKIADIMNQRIKDGGLDRRVLGPSEPNLIDYFERHANAPPMPIIDNNSQEYYSQEAHAKVRGDMAVQHVGENKTMVIDFTFTESTIPQAGGGGYVKVGQAAEVAVPKKLHQYNDWDITNSSNSLVIFGVETFGVVSNSTMDYLNSFIGEEEDRGAARLIINQQLSVALHTIRAKAFTKIKDNLTMDQPPTIRMQNGNNFWINLNNRAPTQ